MSLAYIDQYRMIHRDGTYGATAVKRAPYILPHVQAIRPSSVIDYGCGNSRLWSIISECGVPIVLRYDPALPEFSTIPNPSDMLVSVDVLEHIPENDLDRVISHMASLAERAVIIIDGHLAKTILPNGDNAHATVRPPQWWQERLRRHYPYVERIGGVRRRPASFRTWRLGLAERMLIGAQIAKYRLLQPLRLA